MVARELWSCIGGLFGYDPGMKNVEAKALNKRMAEAIGGAKSMPGYSAEKTIHELNDISKERAEEEIRQNESMLEDAAAKTNDTIAKLTISACVKDNISGPGLATMKYLSDHSGKVSYVPESLVKARDMTDFIAKPGQKTWGSERSGGDSALDRIKYLGMGLMTSGSPYSIPLIAASAPEGESKEGSGNWWKYVLALGTVAGAMFGGYKMFIDTPENRFVNAAQGKGVSAGEAGDIYDSIYDSAMNDRQITVDRQKVVSGTAQRVLDSGVVAQHPKNWTLWGIGNMTVAEDQLGLPKVPDAKLVEAAQADPEYKGSIVDFTVLHVKNNDGILADVGSASPARDTWMLAKLLTERPDLAPQAGKHAWLNQLVRQNAYNMFDNPYGLKGVDYKESHVPTEAKVWEVLLGFSDYMDKLPARLAADGIPQYFPYDNSTKLKGMISDYTNRTIALMYLADVPRSAWDNATKAEVKGLAGMQKFMDNLQPMYDKLVTSYNQVGTQRFLDVPSYKNVTQRERAFQRYYDLLIDRRNWGLKNTVNQFIDTENAPRYGYQELLDYVNSSDRQGVSQILERANDGWKLNMFILGKMRNIPNDYLYDYPQAYKALGIPCAGVTRFPYIDGTALSEYAVPVADKEVLMLKQRFGNKIAIGPGNMVGLNSCVYGAELDGAREIYQSSGADGPCTNFKSPVLWSKK